MIGTTGLMHYMFAGWGIVTAILMVLVIYGNTLSINEDDQLYLNRAEQEMMGAEQRVLIGKMDNLARVIIGVAFVSAILFLASAGLWVRIGLLGS